MTTIEIYETGNKCEIPSSWEELSSEQVRYIVQLYDKSLRANLSPLEFNVRVLYYLMGMKHDWRSICWERLNVQAAIENRNANIYMLCERCLDWLFKEQEDGCLVLNYTSIVNALPSVSTGLFRRRLYGPNDGLVNLSFGEFRHAATSLNEFFKTHRDEDLNECIAHLYRVKTHRTNRSGRRVESIDNDNIRAAIRRASHMKTWQKTLVMMWFANCINYLQTGTVHIEGEDVDMSRLFTGGSSDNSGLSATWQDLLIEVAKENTIGNIERVDEEPLYSIISIMWHNHKENKRNEKASKTN